MDYAKHCSIKRTTADQPILGREQEMGRNEAGGFVFKASPWILLERFLILGTEGGAYYVGEKELTIENARNAVKCIEEDGSRVVEIIKAISSSGRAPKNEPALFVLALTSSLGDHEARRAAYAALPQVARTGTHLLHFANYMRSFKGWSRGYRRAVASWFTGMGPARLTLQALKYKQRDGWALKDLLRLSHPKTNSETHNAIFKYLLGGEIGESTPEQIQAADKLVSTTDPKEAAKVIAEYRLPHEAVPVELKAYGEVWEALSQDMPLMALIRSLAKLTAVGVIGPSAESTARIANRIANREALQRARVHPLSILNALTTYQNGRGLRGKLSWNPERRIVDALDEAFYLAFGAVEPTHKRFVLGLDVSGSMRSTRVVGMETLRAHQLTGAMSLVTAAVEKDYHTIAFNSKAIPVSISPRQRLDDVVKMLDKMSGSTNCAAPIEWAIENKVPVDTFVIYTDIQNWGQSSAQPVSAIREYRQKMGIPAKLITAAFAANSWSLHGERDEGMLDIVGADENIPQLISDFASN